MANLQFRLAAHQGRERIEILDLDVPGKAEPIHAEFAGARWRLELKWSQESSEVRSGTFTATVVSGRAGAVAAGLVWNFSDWSVKNYVLIPGAVYAGNRFQAERRPYSPAIRDIGQKADALRLDVGDIPRLNEGPGRSHLDQTSLDAAIPGLGIQWPAAGEARLWLTPQSCACGPVGFEIIESETRNSAEVVLLAPGFLHPLADDDDPMPGIGNQAASHRHPQNAHPVDLEAGESIAFTFQYHHFPCPDVSALFARVFAHRTAMFCAEPAQPLPDVLPFSAAWDALERKHNEQNWCEAFGLYKVGLGWVADQATQFWQSGWVGGGITTLAMLQEGAEISVERALRNLEFLLTKGVSAKGFFKPTMAESGQWKGDGAIGSDEAWCEQAQSKKATPHPRTLSLVRRQGDCLLFCLRQFIGCRERGREVPAHWVTAVRRAAEALVRVWEEEGEFGFLLNYETGSVAIRGSTSGALIPAALALAAAYFEEPHFLSVALASAEHYRTHDLAWGVTTGGPGDALQAPDGESIFGLIESYITLFEMTGDTTWRQAAVQACYQGASWAISFPYVFPEDSALARIGCDARGTMIANAQNKCGVPGICTLAGQGILRTFRATGDVRLLDLLREIAHALPQFLSREDRRIPTRITWAHPFRELPPGWMCERVNITPSWSEPLGEQAAYSCWCEVAMMLTWCDLPGVYAQPDTGLIRCLDHVRAEWSNADRTALRISNPTKFPARVRVQMETSARAESEILSVNYAAALPQIEVQAGGYAIFSA